MGRAMSPRPRDGIHADVRSLIESFSTSTSTPTKYTQDLPVQTLINLKQLSNKTLQQPDSEPGGLIQPPDV